MARLAPAARLLAPVALSSSPTVTASSDAPPPPPLEPDQLDVVRRAIQWLPPAQRTVAPAPGPGVSGARLERLCPFPLPARPLCPHTAVAFRLENMVLSRHSLDDLFTAPRRFVALFEEHGSPAGVGVVADVAPRRRIFPLEPTYDLKRPNHTSALYLHQRVRVHHIYDAEEGIPGLDALVEVTALTDEDEEEDCAEAQEALRAMVKGVAALQRESGEVAILEKATLDTLDLGRSGPGSLWALVERWQQRVEAEGMRRMQRMETEVAQRRHDHLSGAVDLGESTVLKIIAEVAKAVLGPRAGLSAEVAAELRRREDREAEEVQRALLESCLWTQLMLQSTSHGERLALFSRLMAQEERRLQQLRPSAQDGRQP